MIYTSYFGAAKKFDTEKFELISISRSCPKGFMGLQFKVLSPSYDILSEYKREYDEKKYIERFKAEVLANLDADNVVKRLQNFAGGRDIVLLCYEKPGDFCHRHLVADWLNEHGYEAKEFEW